MPSGTMVSWNEDKGFGFILMEGQTKFQMDGDIDIDFPPEGVVLKLNFPIGG